MVGHNTNGWKICEYCGRKTKRIRMTAERQLACYPCSRKFMHILGGSIESLQDREKYNEGFRKKYDKAINKVYEIKGRKQIKDGHAVLLAWLSVPNVLIGHKFKMQIIDKE